MLVNGDDFYCGNASSNPLQLALKSMIPDTSSFAKSSDLESLKTSVSSGKSLIASAVTGKGVNTAADALFQTIANNINAIQTGATKFSKLEDVYIYDGSTKTHQLDMDKMYLLISTRPGSKGYYGAVSLWYERALHILWDCASWTTPSVSASGLLTYPTINTGSGSGVGSSLYVAS